MGGCGSLLETSMNVILNESGDGTRLGVAGGRWAGLGTERRRPSKSEAKA